MQFLESSVLGLRAAIYNLNSPNYNLNFIVFPMVHIGDPLYYKYIKNQLEGCDNIIFEGVKSKKGWFLVQSYKIIVKRKCLGLVTQKTALNLKELPINMIHGDVSEDDFDMAWKKVPFLFRIFILVAAPMYGVYKYLTASRGSLAQGHTLDGLQSIEVFDEGKGELAFNKVIKADRDKKLVQTIEEHINLNGYKQEKTAIIYGASHIPAAISALTSKFGYRVSNSEWIKVI